MSPESAGRVQKSPASAECEECVQNLPESAGRVQKSSGTYGYAGQTGTLGHNMCPQACASRHVQIAEATGQ